VGSEPPEIKNGVNFYKLSLYSNSGWAVINFRNKFSVLSFLKVNCFEKGFPSSLMTKLKNGLNLMNLIV
jgi:hypothetical protein